MDNSFQNSFPVDNIDKKEIISPPQTAKKNMSVLNVGQMLVLVILFIIICLQTVNLLFNPVQDITAEHVPGTIRQQESPDVTGYANEPAIEAVPAESEIIFILGQNNGKLAILSPDGQTVYETFNVYINTLPEFDRNLLIDGIKIRTTEELSSLLEDFSS